MNIKIKYPKEQKQQPQQAPTETIKEGDILVSLWGYEQTNVCFYKVVKATEKTAWLRKLKSKGVEQTSSLSSKVVASDELDDRYPETLKRKIKDYSQDKSRPFIEISSYENAYKWDGRELEETYYY